jgi:hypothetical protein
MSKEITRHCPFCGGEGKFVHCVSCGADGGWASTEAGALRQKGGHELRYSAEWKDGVNISVHPKSTEEAAHG